jgi:Fur family peroxide stress response transcriptional regulator
MSSVGNNKSDGNGKLNERLATSGLRFTPQREHVYKVLLDQRDHPKVEEVFLRAKQGMPEISMATVYNCLDALVKCGLVRQVHVERAATRFCPNMTEHCHFYCQECGGVFDIDCDESLLQRDVKLPRGFRANHYEFSLRGTCRDCAAKAKTH